MRAVAALALEGQKLVLMRCLAMAFITKRDQVLWCAFAAIGAPFDVMHFRAWQAAALAGETITGLDASVIVCGLPRHGYKSELSITIVAMTTDGKCLLGTQGSALFQRSS